MHALEEARGLHYLQGRGDLDCTSFIAVAHSLHSKQTNKQTYNDILNEFPEEFTELLQSNKNKIGVRHTDTE